MAGAWLLLDSDQLTVGSDWLVLGALAGGMSSTVTHPVAATSTLSDKPTSAVSFARATSILEPA